MDDDDEKKTTIACEDDGMRILEGNYVVVQKIGGEHMRTLRMKRGQQVNIEKLRFIADGAFGQQYGLFEVRDKQLIATTTTSATAAIDVDDLSNRLEIDDETDSSPAVKKQRLTHDAIAELKGSGATTDQLVHKLVEGSATFAARSTYAQDKYIRRKTRKHADHVLIQRPTIRNIVQCYYRKEPERVANLRIDQLALMLSLSGVRSGCRAVVFDECLGVVSAAVLDRIDGQGMCIQVHRGEHYQSTSCINTLNFSDRILDTLYSLPMSSILKQTTTATTTPVDITNRIDRRREYAMHVLLDGDDEVDCMLIALKTANVIDLLEHLYPYLALSAPVVIYSAMLQPLTDAYRWLKEHGSLNVQLIDTFYRKHQILTDRTHPDMNQMIASGYILSGIKVISSTVEQSC